MVTRQPRRPVGGRHGDGAAVDLGHPAREREPEPHAGRRRRPRRAGGVEPVERIEHTLARLGRECPGPRRRRSGSPGRRRVAAVSVIGGAPYLAAFSTRFHSARRSSASSATSVSRGPSPTRTVRPATAGSWRARSTSPSSSAADVDLGQPRRQPGRLQARGGQHVVDQPVELGQVALGVGQTRLGRRPRGAAAPAPCAGAPAASAARGRRWRAAPSGRARAARPARPSR